MRIAVTYNNGEIFQHFGHSEEFKIYEVDNGIIISAEVINTNGSGHGALASMLGENGVDVLICGGIGGGAFSALSENGIEVCAGASGEADEAVRAYLAGTLVDTGVNCSHHGEGHSCGGHEEGAGCGGHEEGAGCGGGCNSGCGRCHSKPAFDGPNVGRTCRVHYKGTFNSGEQFDSSYDRGEPLEFVCGAGMMIQGFDKAVATMEAGETVDIHLLPNEAYGESDPNAIFTIEFEQLPGSEELEAGQKVYLQNAYGQPFPVTVTAKDDTTITFDANHEMAGKELNFRIELIEVI